MARISILILLLGAIASLAVAASPPTFCKCTCFTNSTIIPLGPGHEPPPPPVKQPGNPDGDAGTASSSALSSSATSAATASARAAWSEKRQQPALLGSRAASSSCSQCNRAFCLQYNLPICKNAEEKDVVTMCFARDSRKDQIIVWAFILGTGGLLGWAAAQRAIEYRDKRVASGGGVGAGAGAGAGILGRVSAATRGIGAGGGGSSSRSAGLGCLRSSRRNQMDAGNRGDYVAVEDNQGEGAASGLGVLR